MIEAQQMIEPIHDNERHNKDKVKHVQKEHRLLLNNKASNWSVINTRSDNRAWRAMVNYLAHINAQ